MSNKLPCPNLMEDYQYAWIAQWQFEHRGTMKRPAAQVGKLLEEVLELAFASGMLPVEVDAITSRETFKALQRGEANGEFNRDKVVAESGDVIVCAAVAFQHLQIDTITQVEKTFEVIQGRQWVPNIDGILTRPEKLTDADKQALAKEEKVEAPGSNS